ncbi:PilZ domain-containing protein [Sphingomonas sp. NPDC079357]|uniref:PilZ domain-containing protein n=1 Tax=Sphingomonas sp. NPDC079357 TaxID=3364518 RepID=UPI00384D6D06
MAVRSATIAYEDRVEPRDETLHRTRLIVASGESRLVTIVNVSLNGFMARSDDAFAVGDLVTVTLPVAGSFTAEVRWALGGRIGCKLAQEVPPALYQFVLSAMR